jgi:hypothetical protein
MAIRVDDLQGSFCYRSEGLIFADEADGSVVLAMGETETTAILVELCMRPTCCNGLPLDGSNLLNGRRTDVLQKAKLGIFFLWVPILDVYFRGLPVSG